MSAPLPRYQIGPLDRITVEGTSHQLVSSDRTGYLLQSVSDPNNHTHLSHEKFAELIRSDLITCDQGYFSRSGAMHQQSGARMLLSQLNSRQLEDLQRREDTVKRFLVGYSQGSFSKSTKGYSQAARAIAAAQHQDAREAYERQLAVLQAEAEDEEETSKLLLAGGSRKGLKRHDGKDCSPTQPAPPSPRKPLSGRTLAEWVRRYEKGCCNPLSLLGGYRNCGLGSKLDPELDAIIEGTIAEVYLTETQPSKRHCSRMVERAVEKANVERAPLGKPPLRIPSYRAVTKRIANVPAFTRVRSREGAETAAVKFATSSGGAGARIPMQRVEIDEWTTHVHLINGKPVPKSELAQLRDRHYEKVRLTVAAVICCHTRSILGISVSHTASPENVKNALRMALSDRSGIVRAVGALSSWGPPAGLIEIFSDTGPSFDATFRGAVMGLGGTLVYGPAKKSQLRPFVERFFRTLDQRFMQHFTGRTFSNTQALGAYPAEQRASLTVEQFRQLLIVFIVDEYHNTPHSGLRGQTPREAWSEAIRIHELPMPPDRNRLRANLGTRHRRKISGEGIYFANIPYTSAALQDYRLRKGNETLEIAVDCNDINHISAFFDGKWHTLKSPTDKLRGVPLIVWRSVSNELRRAYAEQAFKSCHIVLQALDRIQQTSNSAIVAAELGAIQPTAEEIQRDEGKLRISWTEPQAQKSSADLADAELGDVGEFIPFTGGLSSSEQDQQSRKHNDHAQKPVDDGGEPSNWLWQDDD